MVERIRTLLESRQLTPTQFADLIGVARPIISHILSGRNKPSLDVVQRILAALPDLSMAWLLNGTEPMLTTANPPVAPVAQPVAAPVVPEPSVEAQAPAALAAPSLVPYAAPVANMVDSQPTNVIASGAGSFPLTAVQAAAPAGAAPVAQGAAAQPTGSVARRPMPRRFPVKLATEPVVAPPPFVLPLSVAADSSGAGTPLVGSAAAGAVAPTPYVSGNILGNEVDTAILSEPQPAVAVGPGAPAAPAAPTMPSERPLATVSGSETVPTVAPAPAAATAPASVAAPTLANDMASALFTGAEKPIRRIVIFYRDGSFADYQPE